MKKSYILGLAALATLSMGGCNLGGGSINPSANYTVVGTPLSGVASGQQITYDSTTNRIWTIQSSNNNTSLCYISANATSSQSWTCSGVAGITIDNNFITSNGVNTLYFLATTGSFFQDNIISYNTSTGIATTSSSPVSTSSYFLNYSRHHVAYYNGLLYTTAGTNLFGFTPSAGGNPTTTLAGINSGLNAGQTIDSSNGNMYGFSFTSSSSPAFFQNVSNNSQSGTFGAALPSQNGTADVFNDLVVTNNNVYACGSGNVYSLPTSASSSSSWNVLGPTATSANMTIGCNSITSGTGQLFMFGIASTDQPLQLYKSAI